MSVDYATLDRPKLEIEDLSYEVLYLTLSAVKSICHASILQARLVCSRWNQISQPLIYRKLNLTISPRSQERNEFLFQQLGNDSDLRGLLREIHVHNWFVPGLVRIRGSCPPQMDWMEFCSRRDDSGSHKNTLDQLDQLCDLISKSSIRKFIWSAKPRLPANLINSLQTYQPQCNIHVHFRNDIDFAFGIISPPADTSLKNIQLLRGLQNLTSLGTGIQRAKKSHFIELQKAAFGHKLRSLTVHSLGRIANGEDPTPFTEYPWSRAPEACKASQLTRLELLNFCICTSLDAEAYWLNTFSWSLLTHVTLTCASFLTSSIIGERLLNLKSLTLNLESQSDHGPGCPGSINRARIKKFLLRCRRLSELELISCTSAVDEQLLIHLGKTLTALKLHEYEIRGVVGKRVLSTAQLEKLGQHCPLVRKLSIDVAYMKGWPYATFDAISKHLWFVRSLELNFELYGREVFRDSQPTLKTARDIWDYLRSSSNRAHSAPTAPTVEESQHTHLALEALDISVGPYRKPDMMYSSDHDAVMQMLPGYQRTYQVRLVGKDQNELPEHVQVTCVEFEETKRKQTEDLGYHEHWESYVRQVEKIAENGMESLPESVA